jgi:uncharacterized protein YbjT (DUF2867 family)
MTANHKHDNPILVTGAAGAVGGIGRNLTEFLLARGHKVRTLVRREDERAEALRRLGAEVVEGDLTGSESADPDHYARVFSEALGRPILYRDVPLPAWSESLRQAGFSEHLVRHLSATAELTRQGRYDRMTDTMCKLTGEAPTNMRDFVKLHAAEFKQREPA